MRRSLLAILAGLGLAVLGAASVAKIAGLPLVDQVAGELPIWHLLRTALPIAAFALPGALTAILLAEARRVRGLAFWLFIGAVLGAIGYLTLTTLPSAKQDVFKTARALMLLIGSGLFSGWLYWWIAGRNSGALSAALDRSSRNLDLDEKGLRKRCRACTSLAVLLGLLPLAMVGWHLTHKSSPTFLTEALVTRAETSGTQTLRDAGLAWANFKIDNHIGRVTGVAPDQSARSAAFDKAKVALAPLVGLPGVVAYLQNDISVPEPVAVPVAAPVADAKQPPLKGAEKVRAAQEAKRKADQAAAAEKARALEDDRRAAAAKRQLDENAAKAAAAEAAEQLRVKEAKQRAEDEKRLADDLIAQRKADEEKSLAQEAEAERKAVEAARKAEAEKVAAEKAIASAPAAPKPDADGKPTAPATAPAASTPPAAADAACAKDFDETFKATTIRFPLNASSLDDTGKAYLDRVARVAKSCTGYRVAIAGHADRSGSDATNLKTSLDRAIAVRDALVARGVTPEHLVAEGFGERRPVAASASRALNRRIELSAIPMTSTPAATTPNTPLPVAPSGAPSVQVLPIDACNSDLSRALRSVRIRFAGSSALVTDRDADAIESLARLLHQCPKHKLAINGHTDRRGRASANQALSLARADAVREALIDRDIEASRLSTKGFGGRRPIIRANALSAFAVNRRVDFDVSIEAP